MNIAGNNVRNFLLTAREKNPDIIEKLEKANLVKCIERHTSLMAVAIMARELQFDTVCELTDGTCFLVSDDLLPEMARKLRVIFGTEELVATIQFVGGRYSWTGPLIGIDKGEIYTVDVDDLLDVNEEVNEEGFPMLNMRSQTADIVVGLYDSLN